MNIEENSTEIKRTRAQIKKAEKEARRREQIKRLDAHLFWIRDERGAPMVLVAYRIFEGTLLYAMAAQHPKDVFSRENALNKALGRLEATHKVSELPTKKGREPRIRQPQSFFCPQSEDEVEDKRIAILQDIAKRGGSRAHGPEPKYAARARMALLKMIEIATGKKKTMAHG